MASRLCKRSVFDAWIVALPASPLHPLLTTVSSVSSLRLVGPAHLEYVIGYIQAQFDRDQLQQEIATSHCTDLSSGMLHICFSSAVNISGQYELSVNNRMRVKAPTNEKRLALFAGDGWVNRSRELSAPLLQRSAMYCRLACTDVGCSVNDKKYENSTDY